MANESSNKDIADLSDEVISGAEIVTDLVLDTAVPVVPGPVRRNFLKAFGHLCTAAIDIPVAYLTGKADEIRAETAGRIKIINTSAEQIAEQMRTDPEYARVAVQKFGQRVLREQVNLDMIAQKAAVELQNDSDSSEQSGSGHHGDTIDDDWLNAFETEARQISTEEMQAYFARVLAGEIRKPGSYSRRTVKILGSLDQNIASNFVRLCSIAVRVRSIIVVPSLGGHAGMNALKEYGIYFSTLNLLNEHGLVISDYNSRSTFTPCVALPMGMMLSRPSGLGQQAICTPMMYQGMNWILMPTSDDKVGNELKIDGVVLTQTGRELFDIVEFEPMEEYSDKLAEFLKKNGYRMKEVAGPEPRIVNVDTYTETEIK